MKNCLDYSLNYINRFPKTEKELTVQLRKKWYLEQDIERTINFLKRKWFIDDKKFVEMYIYSELIKKWKPIIIVKNKLYQKWVDMEIVEKIINESIDDIQDGQLKKIGKEIEKLKLKWIDWFSIINKLINKWYKIDMIKKLLSKKFDK